MLCSFGNISPSHISSFGQEIYLSHILSEFDSTHLGINLQWIATPYHIQSKRKTITYDKKKNQQNKFITKKYVIYNQDLKACGHISSETVIVHLGLEYIYLKYKDSNIVKIKMSCQ